MTELFTQAFWDARYGSQSELWSGRPNPRLVIHAADLTVGRALDVGCGEGADAIWLAERGWRVTALDISRVALDRGATRAAAISGNIAARIDWFQEDLLNWDGPEPGSYDLVSAQFMHLPREPRERLYRRLSGAVTASGTLLIVGHDASGVDRGSSHPPMSELFFTAAEAAASLEDRAWDVVVKGALERFGSDPNAPRMHTHDVVLCARRHPDPATAAAGRVSGPRRPD